MHTEYRLSARTWTWRPARLLAILYLGCVGCGKVTSNAAPEGGGMPDAGNGMAGDQDAGSPDLDARACANGTDKTSDSENCGACGRSCVGGACVASACHPVALAIGQNNPGGLAVDAVNVYWTTTDGNVVKVPIDGGNTTVLASGQKSPRGVAVDALNVYWVNAVTPGQVMSVPIAGGTPTVLADMQRRPVNLVVNNGVIYWTNSSNGTIMSVPASGGTVVQLAANQGSAVAIAIEANTLYWSSIGLGVIRSLPLIEGGTITTIASDQDAVALSVLGTTVYWANVELTDDGSTVFKLPASNGAPVDLATSSAPVAVVTDGVNVYWTDETSNTIQKVSVRGGAAEVIATDQPTPSEIAIDGANIYWIDDVTNGTIMKLAK